MPLSDLRSEAARIEALLAADEAGTRELRFDEIALLLQRLNEIRVGLEEGLERDERT